MTGRLLNSYQSIKKPPYIERRWGGARRGVPRQRSSPQGRGQQPHQEHNSQHRRSSLEQDTHPVGGLLFPGKFLPLGINFLLHLASPWGGKDAGGASFLPPKMVVGFILYYIF